jgi:hypothetical protein
MSRSFAVALQDQDQDLDLRANTLASAAPPLMVDRAAMSIYTGNRGHDATKHQRQESQLQLQPHSHIALGTHEVPLLDHQLWPLNFARLHHAHVPHPNEPGYTHYKTARDGALANAVCALEKDLGARCAVDHIKLENERLIVRHSQSKLSQQELADLQKATHFDKKELQQWYKGVYPTRESHAGRG